MRCDGTAENKKTRMLSSGEEAIAIVKANQGDSLLVRRGIRAPSRRTNRRFGNSHASSTTSGTATCLYASHHAGWHADRARIQPTLQSFRWWSSYASVALADRCCSRWNARSWAHRSRHPPAVRLIALQTKVFLQSMRHALCGSIWRCR